MTVVLAAAAIVTAVFVLSNAPRPLYIRWQSQLDWLGAHFSGKQPERWDPQVRVAMRLGIDEQLARQILDVDDPATH